MKKVTCRMMGGMCDHEMTVGSYEESMSAGMAHLKEAHPEMAAQVESAPKDDPQMVEWEAMWKKKWAETPEV